MAAGRAKQALAEILASLRDEDAEQALLGCCLLGGLDAVREIIGPSDFYWSRHQVIYRACLAVADRNQPVDVVTVAGALREAGLIEKAGGLDYLAALGTTVAGSSNVLAYASRVKNLAVRRNLVKVGLQIVELAHETEDVEELLAQAQAKLYAAAGETPSEPVRLAEAIEHRLQYLEATKDQGEAEAVMTGFVDLDRQTGGLMPGTLTILAGRPGMGKSALGLQIAIQAAQRNRPTLFFSLEMTAEELADRVVAMHIGADTMAIRKRILTEDEWAAAWKTWADAGPWLVYLDCTPALTTAQIRARCRKMQAKVGLDFVVVDYLQRISDKPSQVVRTRNELVGAMTRQLKSLALELKVPVLVLCQLNRAVEATQDKRPGLAHLRESGEIEQDADNVWFVYRPEYYWPDKLEHQGKAEVIVAKHRNGPTGSVWLQFNRKLVKFASLYEEV
ncbi:MAG: replicative DNA helicase [Moorellales bacterium]